MKPPSLRAAASAPTVKPIVGARPLPALVIPRSRDVRTLERTSRDYGKKHAATAGYPATTLAVAAFDALCSHHGLRPRHVGGGRWSTRPPEPHVVAARERLGATASPRPAQPSPSTAPF